MVKVKDLITRAEQIAAEEPAYQQGHDGHDGLCDCIGLIIGAIRRAGGQWRGLHGSNYAARSELADKIAPITGSGDLQPGEVVFKAYEPGQGGYNLPKRYGAGGESYNGDLRDYNHVGLVVSINPLRIRHMTSPRAKMDTKLGKWGWHGYLKKVDYSESGDEGGKEMEKVIISGGNPDEPIRLRKAASTTSAILAEMPQGSEAELIEDKGAWIQITWSGKTGYVMSIFVHRVDDGGQDGETVSVNRAELEKIYDTIGDMLGLRG